MKKSVFKGDQKDRVTKGVWGWKRVCVLGVEGYFVLFLKTVLLDNLRKMKFTHLKGVNHHGLILCWILFLKWERLERK